MHLIFLVRQYLAEIWIRIGQVKTGIAILKSKTRIRHGHI